MTDHDERLWDLELTACDDGDLLLRQADPGHDEGYSIVRLHRSHLPLIAQYIDAVPREGHAQAIAHERQRFGLLAAAIRAHTRPGEPLRMLCDLLGGGSIRASPAGERRPEAVAPLPIEGPNNLDLFDSQPNPAEPGTSYKG